MRIDRLELIEVLKDARDGHLDGHRYRLVHYPDWGCLGSVLAAEAPGHQNACIACPVSRDDWKRYGFDTQAERSLGYYDTPLRSFLDLFESPLDVGYDVSHCVKDVVISMGLHGMDLWLQDHNPALVPELRSVFKAHTKGNKYVPPFDRGPGQNPDRWRPECYVIRHLLRDKLFWRKVCDLLPKRTDGVRVVFPDHMPMAAVAEPLQYYLRELCRLCRQLISFSPKAVHRRERDCRRLHMLFSALHMPIERLTVQSHYFLYHYQQRLLRHGNLQMVSTEGGEHTHQDVKDVVGLRRSKPSWKCPIGLVALLEALALKLALWAEERLAPRNWLGKGRKVTLPRYIFVLLLLGPVAHPHPPNHPTTHTCAHAHTRTRTQTSCLKVKICLPIRISLMLRMARGSRAVTS